MKGNISNFYPATAQACATFALLLTWTLSSIGTTTLVKDHPPATARASNVFCFLLTGEERNVDLMGLVNGQCLARCFSSYCLPAAF